MIISINSNKKLNGDYLKVNNKRFVNSIARNNKSKFYASGIQVLNPKKINNNTKKVDNFYDLWSQLIKKKLLLCSNIQPEKWCEIDTIKQLKDQNKKLK